jgi:hypothetical protein
METIFHLFQSILVSFYRNVKDQNPITVPLTKSLDSFVESSLIKDVLKMRRERLKGNEKEFIRMKSQLPGFVFQGVMNGPRLPKHMETYNKLVVLDYDKLPEERIQQLKKLFSEIKYSIAVWKSTSGCGLKVLVMVDSERQHHEQAFLQVAEYYDNKCGIKSDPKVRDLARLHFISYDIDIFINSKAEIFNIVIAKASESPESKSVSIEQKDSAKNKRIAEDIIKYLEETNQSITFDHERWYKAAYALCNCGLPFDDALNLYLRLCRLDGEKHDEEKSKEKFDYCWNSNDKKISIATLIDYAKEVGFRRSKNEQKEELPEFWYIVYQRRGGTNLRIDKAGVIDLLNAVGFRIYNSGGAQLLVRINDGIIDFCTTLVVKDFLKNHTKNLSYERKEEVYDELRRSPGTLLNKDTFEYLDVLEDDFHWDTSNEVFVYFKNGCVKITKDDFSLLPYGNFDSFIWRKQIKKHEIHLLEDKQISDFRTFAFNICGQDQDRFLALCTAIGYLISRYKDPSNTKAIILIDESFSNDKSANGGRGKTLICHAIGKIRNSLMQDSKNYSFERFAFQQVTPETNVIIYDDVKEKFKFEQLYSIITSGIDVEKKGEDRYNISAEKSPKILITSNYLVKGREGESDERRKFNIEISDHYGKQRKPIDEFGHTFFDDWDHNQWNEFFNFMIYCVQAYLQHGLYDYGRINIQKREFYAKTNQHFIEFIKISGFRVNTAISLKSQLDLFKDKFPIYRSLTQRSFNGWYKTYFEYIGVETYESIRTEGKEYWHNRDGKQYFSLDQDNVDNHNKAKDDL